MLPRVLFLERGLTCLIFPPCVRVLSILFMLTLHSRATYSKLHLRISPVSLFISLIALAVSFDSLRAVPLVFKSTGKYFATQKEAVYPFIMVSPDPGSLTPMSQRLQPYNPDVAISLYSESVPSAFPTTIPILQHLKYTNLFKLPTMTSISVRSVRILLRSW